MRIKVNRSQLINSFDALSSIASHKYALPILSCILIGCLERKITLTATDLTLSLTCSIPAMQAEPGFAVVNFECIKEIVDRSCDEEVEIGTEDGKTFYVISGANQFETACQPTDLFPKVPDFSSGEAIMLGQSTLKRALGLVSFAARDWGVQFHFSGDTVTLVAGDVAAAEVKIFRKISDEMSFILPVKALSVLNRCLGEGRLALYKSTNNVLLDLDGDRRIVSRIEEKEIRLYEFFKDVSKLDHKNMKNYPLYYLRVNRKKLIDALKSAAACRPDIPTVGFHISKDKLKLKKIWGGTDEGNSNCSDYHDDYRRNCNIGINIAEFMAEE